MKIIDARKIRSRVHFECPSCKFRLERRISRHEKFIIFAGALSLGTASLLSILQIQAKSVIIVCCAFVLLVGIFEIRNEFIRKRFYAAPEP